MAGADDPMNPEAWFGEPGVCGSCVAWRPVESTASDTVAIGLCRLRPELRRVPGDLAKCPKYRQRGVTRPEPGRRATRTAKPRSSVPVVSVGPGAFEPRPEPSFRPWPTEPAPPSVELDGGTAPLVASALRDLFDDEIPGRRRDMHSKYRQGGKVTVVDGAGVARSVPAHQVFAWFSRLARSFDALEEAVDTHPSIGAEALDMVEQVRRMRGSFTTFNVLFADREDYFTGKE